jgi:hypothetical protein
MGLRSAAAVDVMGGASRGRMANARAGPVARGLTQAAASLARSSAQRAAMIARAADSGAVIRAASQAQAMAGGARRARRIIR